MMIIALYTQAVKTESDNDHKSLRRDTMLIMLQWMN